MDVIMYIYIYMYPSSLATHLANTHGRFGWNESPFTRADLDSKLTSILPKSVVDVYSGKFQAAIL